MSYVNHPEAGWQTFVPDGPWQSGAPGWSTAPWVGWGMNPNQALPTRQAMNGCGACAAAAASGVGEGDTQLPIWPVFVGYGVSAVMLFGMYKLVQYLDRI